MWPAAVQSVANILPKAFLFENVRGLLRPAFKEYLAYLISALSFPELSARESEPWADHQARLVQHSRTNTTPTYTVVVRGINAADYGAAQKRHRAVVIGVRADVSQAWEFPSATHSRESLGWSQYIDGSYWDRHKLPQNGLLGTYGSDVAQINRMRALSSRPMLDPWLTVRDVIGDLPDPSDPLKRVDAHTFHPGARLYPRHTGSRWDDVSKALKAGAHGVPGGENIIVSELGEVRYYTLREMARLQGLPDEFLLPSGWKAPIRQLGNAVPVQVGEALGRAMAKLIAPEGAMPLAAIEPTPLRRRFTAESPVGVAA